jgi:hypothetical protein
MLEFTLTEGQPLQRPWQCVVCSGSLGVMCDTHKELPQFGNVYVCETCVRHLARVFGLVKGARMTQLTRAATEIEKLEAELREARETAVTWREKAAEMSALKDGLAEDLASKSQRVEQLEARFTEYAKGALEMATAGATTDQEDV